MRWQCHNTDKQASLQERCKRRRMRRYPDLIHFSPRIPVLSLPVVLISLPHRRQPSDHSSSSFRDIGSPMKNYGDLLKLAESQTHKTQEVVRSALAERERKEVQKRKEIAEKEKRERELEAKLRLKKLEEHKREQERRERQEREREAREREIQRREEQQRDALLYGPKKAKDRQGYPVSGAVKRPHSSQSDDEPESSNVLTREEKRQRRLERELRGGRSTFRRSAVGGGGYNKAGRRLPGGAVDITTTVASSSQSSPGKAQSIRERLAAEPAMLIKLNTNKRDTRSIDEIVRDREKARQGVVLDGDSAKTFNNWFGKAKKPSKDTGPVNSASTSRANTPAVGGPSTGSASPNSAPTKSMSKLSVSSTKASTSVSAKGTSTPKPPPKLAAKSHPSASRPSVPSASKAVSSASANKSIPRKRRSPSSSVSPPPARRRPAPGGRANDISSEIWKLFGKDRSSYIQRDVYSDDEDMEADAFDVEREELQRSVRLLYARDAMFTAPCPIVVCVLPRRKTNLHWRKSGATRRRSVGARRRRRNAATTNRNILSGNPLFLLIMHHAGTIHRHPFLTYVILCIVLLRRYYQLLLSLPPIPSIHHALVPVRSLIALLPALLHRTL